MVVFTQGEVDEFIRNVADRLFASMPFGNDFQTQRSKDLYVEGGMKILNLLAEKSGSDLRVCKKWVWEVTFDYTYDGSTGKGAVNHITIDSPYKTDAYNLFKKIALSDYGYTDVRITKLKRCSMINIVGKEDAEKEAIYNVVHG